MNQVYRPDDSFEFDIFEAAWCGCCANDSPRIDCEVLKAAKSHYYGLNKFPNQWILDKGNQPACTEFKPNNQPVSKGCAA